MKGVMIMKKSNLISGLLSTLIGAVFLIIALLYGTKLDSLFYGFAGAGIASGILQISKYFYWSSPKNKGKYQERLEQESIDLQDERKEKYRDKAGRYAYILGLAVIFVSIVVFSILGKLDIISNTKIIIIYLGVYCLFQYIAGIIIFKHLNSKY